MVTNVSRPPSGIANWRTPAQGARHHVANISGAKSVSASVDIAWVTLLIASVLFNGVIGPLTPIWVLASLLLFIGFRWHLIWPLVRYCWPLIILPIFAIFSGVWSVNAGASTWYGFLFLVTVLIAICVGGGLKPHAFVIGFLLATLAFNIAGLLSDRSVGVAGQGAAFLGLAGSKNSAGDTAGLSLLAAVLCLNLSVVKRSAYLFLLSLIGLPVAAYIMATSLATGGIISTAVGLALLLVGLASRSMSIQWRTSFFAVLLLAILILLLSQDFWFPALFDTVLDLGGKDTSLTGRTDLWRKADALVAQRPVLGLGYAAFWIPGNLDAEYLWRMFGIENRTGFNFHSTPKEILVGLGWVGLILFTAVIVVGAVATLVRGIIQPHFDVLFAIAVIAFHLIRTPVEVMAFGSMSLGTIVMFGALATGAVFRKRVSLGAQPPVRSTSRRSLSFGYSRHRHL